MNPVDFEKFDLLSDEEKIKHRIMTNEEKIAELIKVSKMPLEERNEYIEQFIAKSKMKNAISEDNENDEGPIQIDDPDEFYRKLGAIPFKEFVEKIDSLKPNEK